MNNRCTRRTELLRIIRQSGGAWGPARVRAYRLLLGAPRTSTARSDLEALANCGQLVRHDEDGRRFYTLPGGVPRG